MGESINEPILNNNTEPQTPTTQEPTNNPEPVKPEAPKPVTGGEDVLNLLSTVDKGILLKAPSVQSLLENARQQEKDKLYKTIEGKDKLIKEKDEEIKDLKKQLEQKGEDLLMNEKELLEKIESLSKTQDELLKQIGEEKEANRLAKLETYKQGKIAEANGELIESLVFGNTEEEINASVELAKAEYQKITAPLKQQLEQSNKPNLNNAPTPTNPTPAPINSFTADQLKNMSASEYAKYRESILKNLSK